MSRALCVVMGGAFTASLTVHPGIAIIGVIEGIGATVMYAIEEGKT